MIYATAPSHLEQKSPNPYRPLFPSQRLTSSRARSTTTTGSTPQMTMTDAKPSPRFQYAGVDVFAQAGLLSRFFFSWVTPIVAYGRKAALNAADMYAISPGLYS